MRYYDFFENKSLTFTYRNYTLDVDPLLNTFFLIFQVKMVKLKFELVVKAMENEHQNECCDHIPNRGECK